MWTKRVRLDVVPFYGEKPRRFDAVFTLEIADFVNKFVVGSEEGMFFKWYCKALSDECSKLNFCLYCISKSIQGIL